MTHIRVSILWRRCDVEQDGWFGFAPSEPLIDLFTPCFNAVYFVESNASVIDIE